MNSDVTVDSTDALPARPWSRSERVSLWAAMLGLTGFLLILILIQSEAVQSFDESTLFALRADGDLARPVGPEWLLRLARDMTSLGGYAFLLTTIVVICVFLAWSGLKERSRFLAAVTGSGYLLNMLLKWQIARPRPDAVPHLSHFSSASFPSGHAMMAAVFFGTVALMLMELNREPKARWFPVITAVVLSAGIAWTSGWWLIAQRFLLLPSFRGTKSGLSE